MEKLLSPKARMAPFKAALCYILAAVLWFLVADRLLEQLVPGTEQHAWRKALEGWAFVLASAALLYFLVHHSIQTVRRRESRLRETLLGLSVRTGGAFFASLVENLARTFQADVALLCEVTGKKEKRLRVLEGWVKGKRLIGSECCLRGGACFRLLEEKRPLLYPRNLPADLSCCGLGEELRPNSFVGAPLLDAEGKVLGVLTLMHSAPLRDPKLAEELVPFLALQAATELERRRAEEELRRNESLLRVTFDQAFQLMGLMEPDGTLIQINRSAADLVQVDVAGIIGRPFWDTPWWSHSRELQKRLQKAVAEAADGAFVRFEATHPKPGGGMVFIDFSIKPVLDETGRVTLLVPEGRDITDRKQAEEALRVSEERFRSIFDTAAAGMVVMDPGGRMQKANPAFRDFLGYEEEDLRRMNIGDVTHPEDRERTQEYHRRLARGENVNVHYEKRFLTRDGRVVWGHASVACLLGSQSVPSYCIGLVQDITDRKRAEEELRQTNRELDAFVYTVSHDLRQPLTPIIGFAEYLREHCRDKLDAETSGILSEIQGQGEKMLALLEDLLALAKVGKLECPAEPVQTREVIEEVLAELRSRSEESAAEVHIADSMPPVGVPKTLQAQVFGNLIANALQYAGRAGQPIEVGGERRHDLVRFYVRDHGPGIPPEEKEKIFDVFTRGSTGQAIRGTGIGLAIVQKIVQLYQGRVWVEETPGGGATFCIEMTDECTPVLQRATS